MLPNPKITLQITLLLAAVATTSGCRYLLPAHGNSNVQKGEKVKLEFITRDDLDPNPRDASQQAAHKALLDNYLAAFPEMKANPPPGAPIIFAALAAPIAAAAVGYIVDYVSQQVKQEAELYEQQWSVSDWSTGFWKGDSGAALANVVTTVDYKESSSSQTTSITGLEGLTANPVLAPRTNISLQLTESEKRSTNSVVSYLNKYKQEIVGVRIVRLVGEGEDSIASEIVIGFAPAEGQGMFLVKPVSYRCLKAKAKVLGKARSFIPLALPWILGKYPGNEVKTAVDVVIEARWMEKQLIQEKQLASFKIQLPNYNISTTNLLTVGHGLPRSVVGVFGGVPVSLNSKGVPLTEQDQLFDRCGVFKVSAVVTEKDVSNAKNRLIELQKKVDEEKSTLTNEVTSYFKG